MAGPKGLYLVMEAQFFISNLDHWQRHQDSTGLSPVVFKSACTSKYRWGTFKGPRTPYCLSLDARTSSFSFASFVFPLPLCDTIGCYCKWLTAASRSIHSFQTSPVIFSAPLSHLCLILNLRGGVHHASQVMGQHIKAFTGLEEGFEQVSEGRDGWNGGYEDTS